MATDINGVERTTQHRQKSINNRTTRLRCLIDNYLGGGGGNGPRAKGGEVAHHWKRDRLSVPELDNTFILQVLGHVCRVGSISPFRAEEIDPGQFGVFILINDWRFLSLREKLQSRNRTEHGLEMAGKGKGGAPLYYSQLFFFLGGGTRSRQQRLKAALETY